jgi:hypothetical protein
VNIDHAVDSAFLERRDVLNDLELGFGEFGICALVATKSAENVACFILAASTEKPSRRFREPPNNGEQHEQWNDLGCNRKSPTQLGRSALDV